MLGAPEAEMVEVVEVVEVVEEFAWHQRLRGLAERLEAFGMPEAVAEDQMAVAVQDQAFRKVGLSQNLV